MTLNKGDLDNLEKAVYDSMNEIVFDDDRQVWKHKVAKVWGEVGYITFDVKGGCEDERFDEERFFS